MRWCALLRLLAGCLREINRTTPVCPQSVGDGQVPKKMSPELLNQIELKINRESRNEAPMGLLVCLGTREVGGGGLLKVRKL